MHSFDRIPPKQFALIAAFLGILLSHCLDVSEQNAIGNFIVSIGQTILTEAAQSTNLEEHPTKSSLCNQIDQMSAELAELKKQLKY